PSNAVHPCRTRLLRPERFTTDEKAQPSVKESGKAAFSDALKEIDGLLAQGPWMMGAQYTVCDPYALVFYGWGKRIELPMTELKNYTAWKDRMLQRPAVRKI